LDESVHVKGRCSRVAYIDLGGTMEDNVINLLQHLKEAFDEDKIEEIFSDSLLTQELQETYNDGWNDCIDHVVSYINYFLN
jgi:hypothetical protein